MVPLFIAKGNTRSIACPDPGNPFDLGEVPVGPTGLALTVELSANAQIVRSFDGRGVVRGQTLPVESAKALPVSRRADGGVQVLDAFPVNGCRRRRGDVVGDFGALGGLPVEHCVG